MKSIYRNWTRLDDSSGFQRSSFIININTSLGTAFFEFLLSFGRLVVPLLMFGFPIYLLIDAETLHRTEKAHDQSIMEALKSENDTLKSEIESSEAAAAAHQTYISEHTHINKLDATVTYSERRSHLGPVYLCLKCGSISKTPISASNHMKGLKESGTCPRLIFPRKYGDQCIKSEYLNLRKASDKQVKSGKINSAQRHDLLVKFIHEQVLIDDP